MKNLLIALMLLIMAAGAAQASTVGFDEFDGNTGTISPGYSSFSWGWNAFYIQDSYRPDSGFETGTVSPHNTLFNGYGLDLNIRRFDDSLFTFNSAYFTAAWNTSLNIDVKGYLGGSQLYGQTITVDTLSANQFSFDFSGIDSLTLSPFGGVDFSPNDGGTGPTFVMDDFTYNEPVAVPTPEPSTAVLLLAGGSGLAGYVLFGRRRE
ncbi:hypothetical protein BerOc1_00447 [Pseudodesulfovibrio hydrargyri]|uniref:Ice-binding protein C-terminal domain-containing protein n=1 Tax=Pseudodesulfovibrio hydrargyri TaxID=2125990 RepID=A0A1J5N8M4_9BACT|nr:PEP-CTERM sorting domain-containing protein [Pseudodesulfovibrio hydrargyri]OIQ51979.1 hypothetical protein BerOc1_00447 [Pseudodesulfovibrio hydrargyri]